MTARQLAVPVIAALLGGAITAGAITAGGTDTGAIAREQGLLDLGTGDRLTSSEIYERVAPSVVYVRAQTVQPGGGAFKAEASADLAISTGSGFVLDEDGRIVTSAHVVSGVTAVHVTFPGGATVPAQVLAKDEGTDLAVLRVPTEGPELRPLTLGDSDGVRPGDLVVAVGNPTGSQPTAGTGRVSATGRRVEAPGGYLIDDVLQTDAVIEPATSGGPLVAADGRVVGITSRLGTDTGFAVPANAARDVLAQLEKGHKVIRPWLGVRGETREGRVVVERVDPGSPADAAGVHEGDVIEAVDGRPLISSADLLAVVDEHEPGEAVQLGVLRNGSRGVVSVRLTERPATLGP